MNTKIIQLIENESENAKLDFKRAQYTLGNNPKKSELLKDLSAMANHPANDDKFIIIGIEEENNIAIDFHNISSLEDAAKYQQYLDENIEPHINFEYKPIQYKNHQLAYFRIYNNNNRPYLFKKEIKDPSNQKTEFRIGDGYIRHGSSTKKWFVNISKTFIAIN